MKKANPAHILLATAGLLLLAGCGSTAVAEDVHSNAPAQTAAEEQPVPENETARRLLEIRKTAIAACETKEAGLDSKPTGDVPPIEELEKAPVQVGGGPDCEPGWVDPVVLSVKGDTAADEPEPIHTRDGQTVIGYWINGLGWLPVDVVEDPGFKVEDWMAAERSLSGPAPEVEPDPALASN